MTLTTDTDLRDLARMLEQLFTKRRADLVGERPVQLDRELWSSLAELGLVRLTGAESDGGSGADWDAAAVLLSSAAGAAAAVPLAENDLLAGWLLELSGCPRAVIDPVAVRTAAVLDRDGTARHVPWARSADAVVVLWDDGGTWRVADVPHADLRVTAASNLAFEPRDHIAVHDLHAVPGAQVRPESVAELLYRGALARAIAMTGAMTRVLDLAVEHTGTRIQFGRPLGRFQAVQHLVADIAAETALAQAATAAAVSAVADGLDTDDARFAVAAAKSCVGHAASVVVRNAHQCLGAIGFTEEHELHLYTNRLLSWRREYGNTRYWDEKLTAAAIAAGSRGLWPLITGRRS
ncbi:acyl-CoA dehydrogenase family protein [Nocardia sp. R16R-3T]